jgi:hypothetical protein
MSIFSFFTEVPKQGLEALKRLCRLFWLLILFLLRRLLCIIRRDCKKGEEENPRDGCLDVPPDVARRPDPCLYSQRYLMAQGLAVTWDNPDIVVTELSGTPASLPLDPDRDYLVRGTIHNASFDPAIGVSVRCFVRAWGVDFDDRVPVEVDDGGQPAVRIVHIGAWGQAIAVFKWRTPNVDKGHYCLTVECFHPADRVPGNNVGQENTDVLRTAKAGTSLKVVVPFFNRQRDVRAFRMMIDAYEIPAAPVSYTLEQIRGPNGLSETGGRDILARVRAPEEAGADRERFERLVERDAMRGARVRLSPDGPRARQGVGYRLFGYHGADGVHKSNSLGAFPLPPGWAVTIPGHETDEQATNVAVPPKSTVSLDVQVDIPAHAVAGERRRFNLTALDPRGSVVGGVTLDILVES